MEIFFETLKCFEKGIPSGGKKQAKLCIRRYAKATDMLLKIKTVSTMQVCVL